MYGETNKPTISLTISDNCEGQKIQQESDHVASRSTTDEFVLNIIKGDI